MPFLTSLATAEGCPPTAGIPLVDALRADHSPYRPTVGTYLRGVVYGVPSTALRPNAGSSVKKASIPVAR